MLQGVQKRVIGSYKPVGADNRETPSVCVKDDTCMSKCFTLETSILSNNDYFEHIMDKLIMFEYLLHFAIMI